MMTFTQYVLSKMAEESAEFSKEILKGQQQGLFSEHRDKKNFEYIQDEYIDIIARSTLLNECSDIVEKVGRDFNLLINRRALDRETNLKIHRSICKMCYYAYMAFSNGHLQLTDFEEGIVTHYHNTYLPLVNNHKTQP